MSAWALKIPPSQKSRYLGTCILNQCFRYVDKILRWIGSSNFNMYVAWPWFCLLSDLNICPIMQLLTKTKGVNWESSFYQRQINLLNLITLTCFQQQWTYAIFHPRISLHRYMHFIHIKTIPLFWATVHGLHRADPHSHGFLMAYTFFTLIYMYDWT